MASVDMCEHDWPGSGCKECKLKYEKAVNESTLAQPSESKKMRGATSCLVHYDEHDYMRGIDNSNST